MYFSLIVSNSHYKYIDRQSVVATGGVLCCGAVVDPGQGGRQSGAPSMHASMRLRRARIFKGVVCLRNECFNAYRGGASYKGSSLDLN